MAHDGSRADDTVYGVDAQGIYLGVVDRMTAVAAANRPPPRMGRWRWSGVDWVRHREVHELVAAIEQERDERIAAGFTLAGIDWPADWAFRQTLMSYLSSFAEGMLATGDTVPVRSKDKVVRQLSRAQVRALLKALMDFVQAQYQWSWDRKAEIQQ